jgi:hypothetical protein
MNELTDRGKKYADFAHTVRVVTARALAEHERGIPIVAARTAQRFTVIAMAAAAADMADLPRGEILAREGELGARFEARDGRVYATLQLKGFSAITAHGGRSGRLMTSNGAVDCRFTFDTRGKSVCVLLDAPEVRAGLNDFSLDIDAAGN